jgi:hypothetical protein
MTRSSGCGGISRRWGFVAASERRASFAAGLRDVFGFWEITCGGCLRSASRITNIRRVQHDLHLGHHRSIFLQLSHRTNCRRLHRITPTYLSRIKISSATSPTTCLTYHTTYTSCGHTVVTRGSITCSWSYYLDTAVGFCYCNFYYVRPRTSQVMCGQLSCLLVQGFLSG